jgi:hypothetical protein
VPKVQPQDASDLGFVDPLGSTDLCEGRVRAVLQHLPPEMHGQALPQASQIDAVTEPMPYRYPVASKR